MMGDTKNHDSSLSSSAKSDSSKSGAFHNNLNKNDSYFIAIVTILIIMKTHLIEEFLWIDRRTHSSGILN
jgi:hypothetical protein